MKTPSLQQLEQYADLNPRQRRMKLRDDLYHAYKLQGDLEFSNDQDLRALMSRYVIFCDRAYCEASGLEYQP